MINTVVQLGKLKTAFESLTKYCCNIDAVANPFQSFDIDFA